MNAKKYRWSRMYESAEEELAEFLADKNITTAERHEVEGYETHELSPAADTTHIWAVEGTAIFTVAGKDFSLQPGDALDIPAGATCSIVTSLHNFAWFESHDSVEGA